ncbi:MAG: FHA domain-containing protein [Kofleriaceae bacterium]
MRLSVALALLVATSALARAQPADDAHPSYRASVDRVDLEPASIGGYRLRVYLSALSLQGQLLDLSDPKSIRLYLGSSEKRLPFALGSYGATDSETEIVFLVQATSDFADALPQIADSLEHVMLDHLKGDVKVAISMYGETAASPKLAALKTMKGKIALASDNSVADPALLDAVERALRVLRATKPEIEGRPLRKMIVVIGDGRDASGDHDRVTRIGTRAAKEGVRIHALAYSPADLRRPLLVLGELARRSFGTLRWPGQGRKPIADTWNAAFKQLTDEVLGQNVITFFASADDDVAGKKLHVVLAGRTEATSNEVRVPEAATCNGLACDAGYCADDRCVLPSSGGSTGGAILRWVLIIGGGLVGLAVVLALIGWWLTKRQERAPQPPAGMPMPGQPAQGAYQSRPPPGMLPNGRPVPGLLVMTGPRTGERMLLRHGFLVGGQPASDLQLADGYTSSNHAQFMMDVNGSCVVIDLGSTNGTFIDGIRIQQHALIHGMTIKIGATELRFLTE